MKSMTGLIILLLTCSILSAASPDDHLIRISFNDQGAWPPYIVDTEPGYGGVMIDVIQRITSRVGYQIQVAPLPEKRIEFALKTGETDCRPKAKQWVDAPELYLWTEPVLDSADYLVFRKNAGYESRDDLPAGAAVCTHIGYGYPTFEELFASGRLVRRDSKAESAMLGMLVLERCEAVIMNKLVARWWEAREQKFKGHIRFSREPIATAPYRFQFAKTEKAARFIPEFNAELAVMKASGELTVIIDAWIENRPHSRLDNPSPQPAKAQTMPRKARVAGNHAPPFRIIENNTYSGIYFDIAKELAERLGIDLEFIEVPFKRALFMMEQGTADLMLAPNYTPERERYMLYVKPELPRENKAFYTHPATAPITRYEDLKDKMVFIQTGKVYFPEFDRDETLEKVQVYEYLTGIRGIMKRPRAAVIIMPEREGDYLLKVNHIRLKKSPYIVQGSKCYLTISKVSDFAPFLARFAQTLEQMTTDGLVDKTIARYR